MTNPEARYRIRAVSQLTGVPAGTLRAWERRYGVPEPTRTPGSAYRLYDDGDVALLLRMRALCDQGMSPAEAAALAKRESTAGGGIEGGAPGTPVGAVDVFEPSRRRIVAAVRAFDPRALDRSVREAMLLGSARGVFTEVLAPVLREVGDAWHAGEVSVAQEHLASERIETAARDLLRLAQPDAPRRQALLACFADERHVLPLFGAAFDFQSWGYGVVVLGEGLPVEDLAHAVVSLRPDAIGLSLTRSLSPDRAEALVRAYAGACGGVPWVVGGQGAPAIAPLVERAGGLVAGQGTESVRRALEGRAAPEATR